MILGEDEIRKVIPDFHLYQLDQVRWMTLEFGDSEESGSRRRTNLIIHASYAVQCAGAYTVTMKLDGVQQLNLPEIGTEPLAFCELAVENVRDRMMEGINFYVNDEAFDGMSCYCQNIEFIQVCQLDESGQEVVVWNANGIPIAETRAGCYNI